MRRRYRLLTWLIVGFVLVFLAFYVVPDSDLFYLLIWLGSLMFILFLIEIFRLLVEIHEEARAQ